jgi:hypothetical protein
MVLMMMTNEGVKPISILFASDIHFGNYAVSQYELADAFSSVIFPMIPDLDIFFINGDFFDREVNFDSCSFDPIYDTILNLFALCERNQTKLRVLQGTWSHDRGQCKKFEVFYRNHSCTFDFKFVDNIELETIHFQDRDLRVFYVPDDLPFSNSGDIASVVRDKMYELDWEYVDYGCMHGFFDFTFPENISHDNRIVFKKEQFPFVRKIINVGHVHQYRSDAFVYSNGSFDRDCHGDQDPKGCIKVLDYPDHYTAQFIENIHASRFDTLVINADADTIQIVDLIQNHLATLDLTKQIYLRFVTEHGEQYEAVKAWMRENHPTIKTVRKKTTDKDGQYIAPIASSLFVETERRVAPTRKTIAAFIKEYLPEDDSLTIDRIETYLELTPT